MSGAALAWLHRELGASVVATRRLDGASSTAVDRVDLVDGRSVVLKRYVWRGYLDDEPDAPAREVDLMTHAAGNGLSAPGVIAADIDGTSVTDGVPTIVMALLPGAARRDADPRALAEVATEVHATSTADLGHHWYRWYADVEKVAPPNAIDASLWERAIAVWNDGPPTFEPRFIHRDFHPGNVLFDERGVATGIVDWANACIGPIGCDLAHCRWNLIRLSGTAAADAFTAAYASATGIVHDPVWEITSALEQSLHELSDQHVALAEPRLAVALAQLGR